MAHVFPFRAWRFNPAKVSLSDVLTQPYDKITPAMQEKYYAASPYNLIRLELGKKDAGDDGQNNVYTRAAAYLQSCGDEHTLVRDDQPSIYAYSQAFVPPGSSGPTKVRRGFIALCRLHDYPERIVFRHEQTLSKPKADRYELLKTTRVHTGQIFMLYSDPKERVEAAIASAIEGRGPDTRISDEYGVEHVLWQITDSATILTIRDRMEEQPLIIADGHHRYETALAYRNQRRTEEGKDFSKLGRTGQLAIDQRAPYEFVMTTFVNMEDKGLLVLPTHRVVHGLEKFDPGEMRRRAERYFEFTELGPQSPASSTVAALSEAGILGTAFVACTSTGSYLLRARKIPIADFLSNLPKHQRELDVVQLHKILLQEVLGISEDAIRDQTHVEYLRSADEALDKVARGEANVAFLMNPVSVEQMRDVAFADQVMPQKSTDFYPKMLSGLTIYGLD